MRKVNRVTRSLLLQDIRQIILGPLPAIFDILENIIQAIRRGQQSVVGGDDDGGVLKRKFVNPLWEKRTEQTTSHDEKTTVDMVDDWMVTRLEVFGD
jgi:hypothetical protein